MRRLLAQLPYLWRSFWNRQEMDAELADEMRDHLARETEARMARGLSARDAAREAAVAFGGVTRHAELVREANGWRWLDDVRVDLRHALRLMRRYPGFAAANIFIAALGIGAATVVYSAVYGVMMRPLPFPHADRLMGVRLRTQSGSAAIWTPDHFARLTASTAVVAKAGLFTGGNRLVIADGTPENLRVEIMTPSLLEMLGVRPLLGRTFLADDAARDLPVALLSFGTWHERFGGDTAIVGRHLQLGGKEFTIVGVMPEVFHGLRPVAPALWIAARAGPAGLIAAGERERGGEPYIELQPGITREYAERWFSEQFRVTATNAVTGKEETASPSLNSVYELMVLDDDKPLLILMAAVGFVLLLVACNIATLGLARATVREHEMGVRQALGASRSRQVRQALTETMLLTVVGGIAGIALAWAGLRLFVRAGIHILPRITDIHLDGPVLGFALGITVLAGISAGLIPALAQSARRVLTGHGQRAGTPRGSRLRNALVLTEVAFSVMLLVGAGLLLKGFLKVAPDAPGFALDHRIAVALSHGPATGPDTLDHAAFSHEVVRRMRALPGVRDVAVSSMMPLVRSAFIVPVSIDGKEGGDAAPRAYQNVVSANWFDLLEIPVKAGRRFTDADQRSSPAVVIVNETGARRWWPGQNPLGHTISFQNRGAPPVTATVVGVSRDIRADGERTRINAEYYLPMTQQPVRWMNFVVRTDGEPRALSSTLKRTIWAVAPTNPVNDVFALEDLASDSVKNARFYTVLVALFAGLAIVLAAAGLFSVLAYAVSRRGREIGIRLAIGAPRGSIVRLVMRQGLTVVVVGLVIGLALARLLTRYMQSVLLEVAPTDTVVFVAAAAGLGVVTAVACAVPMRRALRVDPVASLRGE